MCYLFLSEYVHSKAESESKLKSNSSEKNCYKSVTNGNIHGFPVPVNPFLVTEKKFTFSPYFSFYRLILYILCPTFPSAHTIFFHAARPAPGQKGSGRKFRHIHDKLGFIKPSPGEGWRGEAVTGEGKTIEM